MHDLRRREAFVLGAVTAVLTVQVMRRARGLPESKVVPVDDPVTFVLFVAGALSPREEAVPCTARGRHRLVRPGLRNRHGAELVIKVGPRRAAVEGEQPVEPHVDLVAPARKPRVQLVRLLLACLSFGARIDRRAVRGDHCQVTVVVEVEPEAHGILVPSHGSRARRQRRSGHDARGAVHAAGRAVGETGARDASVRGEAGGPERGAEAARPYRHAGPAQPEVQANAGCKPNGTPEAERHGILARSRWGHWGGGTTDTPHYGPGALAAHGRDRVQDRQFHIEVPALCHLFGRYHCDNPRHPVWPVDLTEYRASG